MRRPRIGAGFIAALEAELPDALRKLQQGQIAPVDLPQAAIGPGWRCSVATARSSKPDGTKMTVRSALARINEILDQVLNEQEGDFDATSRFAIAWYRQHGYGVGQVRRRRQPRARPQHERRHDGPRRDPDEPRRQGAADQAGRSAWDYDVLKDSTPATGRRCTT